MATEEHRRVVQGLRVRDIAVRLSMSESDLYRKQRAAVAESLFQLGWLDADANEPDRAEQAFHEVIAIRRGLQGQARGIAFAYLALLAILVVVGLMTKGWGGLVASATVDRTGPKRIIASTFAGVGNEEVWNPMTNCTMYGSSITPPLMRSWSTQYWPGW